MIQRAEIESEEVPATTPRKETDPEVCADAGSALDGTVQEQSDADAEPGSASLDDATIAALVPQLEACLFVAREPVSLARLAEVVGADKPQTRRALALLGERYAGDHSGVHLTEIAGGWRFLSNPAFADALALLQGHKVADRMSAASLETLAVIAYKQPVGRAEIERVRGVGAGPVLRHLLELEMIRVVGRDDGLGRAMLYGTTKEFLDRFGLGTLRDLPANLDG
jgi:segregation and condensation protein B